MGKGREAQAKVASTGQMARLTLAVDVDPQIRPRVEYPLPRTYARNRTLRDASISINVKYPNVDGSQAYNENEDKGTGHESDSDNASPGAEDSDGHQMNPLEDESDDNEWDDNHNPDESTPNGQNNESNHANGPPPHAAKGRVLYKRGQISPDVVERINVVTAAFKGTLAKISEDTGYSPHQIERLAHLRTAHKSVRGPNAFNGFTQHHRRMHKGSATSCACLWVNYPHTMY